MSLNKKLIEFRKKIKENQTNVITSIIDDHSVNICVFCGETENLTREHVIPQWVYDGCTKRTFITTANKNAQTYNKTAVPACQDCNNSILGELERFLTHRLNDVDLQNEYFTDDEINKIILWLEIIEYKFHVLDLRRNLNKVQGTEYIPYIGKMPIAMFQGPMEQTLAIKSKAVKHNSLCILRTTNPDFHFFHSTNNFIFIELAQYNVAFFFFYKKEFATSGEAATLAQEIVQREYAATGTQQSA